MIKIGIIETVASIIYYKYEVIDIDGYKYAGVDAFSYPDNKNDLRALDCCVIPDEWRWVEKYEKRESACISKPNSEKKYNVIRGDKAKAKFEEMLSRHETGVLCLNGLDYPYAIPMNFAFRDNKLYIHTGKRGLKLELIKNNPKACFTVYGETMKVPDNVRSCHLEFDSMIFYGNIRIAEDKDEIKQAIKEISVKYGTPYQHGFSNMIYILVLNVHHATARDDRFKPSNSRNLYFLDTND